MTKQITVILWDGTTESFVNPGIYRVKPDGLLHIGVHEDDCTSYPFTSIKKMHTTTSA